MPFLCFIFRASAYADELFTLFIPRATVATILTVCSFKAYARVLDRRNEGEAVLCICRGSNEVRKYRDWFIVSTLSIYIVIIPVIHVKCFFVYSELFIEITLAPMFTHTLPPFDDFGQQKSLPYRLR